MVVFDLACFAESHRSLGGVSNCRAVKLRWSLLSYVASSEAKAAALPYFFTPIILGYLP